VIHNEAYRKRPKSWNLPRRLRKFFCLERAGLVRVQGASEDKKFAQPPWQIPTFWPFSVYLLIFSLVLSSCLFSQEYILHVTPPKDWEAVEQTALTGQVKMAFIKKEAKEGFCPSLNLVEEQFSGNLNNYLNDVKAIHEQNRNNRWRRLGKVQTAAGEAELTEIDTNTPFGPVRLLQLFLLKEKCVYILTAAALKKDIPRFYADFQKSFYSFRLESKTDDN